MIEHLTPTQQDIVDSPYARVIVQAQPGSGKTRVLVERLKTAFGKKGFLADQVVAITFTEKAATEIKKRLLEGMPTLDETKLWVSTIHGFCKKILQRHAWQSGLDLNFSVLSAEQSLYLKKRAIAETISQVLQDKESSCKILFKNFGFERVRRLLMTLLNQTHTQIQQLGGDEKSNAPLATIKKLYHMTEGFYGEAKENRLDFDDLLMKCNTLFQSQPEILKLYRQKFKLLMVDEFQDTDHIQNEIILLLTATPGPKPRLMVVGDPMQSIYRFRGAQVELFHNLRRDVISNEGFCFQMVENFRSQKGLIDFTNLLFEPLLENTFVASQPVRVQIPNQKSGVEYWHYEGKEEKWSSLEGRSAEAKWLAKKIRQEIKKNGKGATLAVLFRAMTYAHIYERAFEDEHVDYIRSGIGQLFQTQVVRERLALLRWALDPEDEFSLWMVLSAKWSGLTSNTLIRLSTIRAKNRCSLKSALGSCREKSVTKLLRELQGLIRLMGRVPLEVWFRKLQFTPSRSLDHFFRIIREFEQQNPDANWAEILSYIEAIEESNVSEQEAKEEGEPGVVQLMTVHQSKGLEFDWVYLPDLSYVSKNDLPLLLVDEKKAIVGLKLFDNMRLIGEDDLYKELKAAEKQKDLEERKRLFYVAATRAKDRLVLSHSSKKPRKNSWASWVEQHKVVLEKSMKEASFK